MRKEIKILGAIAVVVIAAIFIGTSLYRDSEGPVRIEGDPKGSTDVSEVLVRPDSPTLGPPDAKVTVVEFVDPECESCAAFHPIIKNTLKAYEGKTRLVIRYMPLHPNSLAAATFLEAAGEQGKYWEAQDYLMEKQPEWGTKHGHGAAEQPDAGALFKKYAADLKLDMDKLSEAFAQNKYAAKIQRDYKDGQSLGVRQTPTIFVNGRKLARLDEMGLRYLIEEGLK